MLQAEVLCAMRELDDSKALHLVLVPDQHLLGSDPQRSRRSNASTKLQSADSTDGPPSIKQCFRNLFF